MIAVASLFAVASLVSPGLAGATARKTVKKTTKTKKTVKVQSSNANYAIAIRTDAKTTARGTTVDYDVLLTKGQGLKGTLQFDVPDLPPGYSYDVSPVTSTLYRMRVSVPATAPDSSTVYVLRALNGSRERAVLFRLTIQSPPLPTSVATTTTTSTTLVPIAFTVKSEVAARVAGPGETVAFPITVDRKGYTGPISFVAEGTPAGSSVGYSPNPSSGNTTLYITPQDSTPSGRFLIVVQAKAGGETRSTAVQLTVRRTGPFTTFIGPLNLQTTPGNDAKFRLDVAAGNSPIPFVELQIAGLPTGAALRPIDAVKAQNALIITTSASTPAGTYPVVLTLTSGTFVRKLSMTLVVAAGAGFAVTPENTGVVVARGLVAPFKVTVTPTGGFAGPLTYAITGLPNGISAAYEVTSTGLTIKFTAAVTAPVGTFPVEFVVSSGSLSATSTINVIVS